MNRREWRILDEAIDYDAPKIDISSMSELSLHLDSKFQVSWFKSKKYDEARFNGFETESKQPVIIKQSRKTNWFHERTVFEGLQQDGTELCDSFTFSGFENIKHIKNVSVKYIVAGFLKSCRRISGSENYTIMNIPNLIYFLCIHYYYRPFANIQKLKWFQSLDDRNIIVWDRLGPSLQDIMDMNMNGVIKLQNILLLADQMISTLQYIHEKGYIHRNLKPEVLSVGYRADSKTNVYITDFSKACLWTEEMKICNFNDLFCSIHSHPSGGGCKWSRGTDLESLGYVLLYLLLGRLPWQNLRLMQKCKRETPLERIENVPKEFIIYITYCRGLRIKERPNYQFLKDLFNNLASNNNFRVYDWTDLENIMP